MTLDWVALPNLMLRMAWQAGLVVFHFSISWSLKKTQLLVLENEVSEAQMEEFVSVFFLESLKDSQVQL